MHELSSDSEDESLISLFSSTKTVSCAEISNISTLTLTHYTGKLQESKYSGLAKRPAWTTGRIDNLVVREILVIILIFISFQRQDFKDIVID